MNYKGVSTAKNSRAKCMYCKEPILKKEGTTKWSGFGVGFACYKCSLKRFNTYMNYWKAEMKILDKHNHIGEKRMNELKIAKMV